MALTLKTEQPPAVVTQERTYELLVRNRLGEVPAISARRQQIEMQGTDILRQLTDAVLVERALADVSKESIALAGHAGVNVSVAELWQTIASLLDRWAIEDEPEKKSATPTP